MRRMFDSLRFFLGEWLVNLGLAIMPREHDDTLVWYIGVTDIYRRLTNRSVSGSKQDPSD